jgi:hypothetical protein
MFTSKLGGSLGSTIMWKAYTCLQAYVYTNRAH